MKQQADQNQKLAALFMFCSATHVSLSLLPLGCDILAPVARLAGTMVLVVPARVDGTAGTAGLGIPVGEDRAVGIGIAAAVKWPVGAPLPVLQQFSYEICISRRTARQ